jgi:LPS-assembly protein
MHWLPSMRLFLYPALVCLCAGAASPALAAEESWTPEQRRKAPVYLQADRLSGHTDRETILEGDAELRKADTAVRADRLEYDQPTDQARALGHVRVERGGNVYEGPQLELKVGRFEGFFRQPSYQFRQNEAHGEADRADFLDENHTVVLNATYTTCRRLPGPSWMPDWILRAASISLDNEEEVGVAHGAYLSFKGVPILPVPAISFPLTEKRKSGLLPPTLGVDNVNGTEVAVPYYWNIAPNRDATITPNFMSARGVDLGLEFRYLESSYTGIVRADYMPGDHLRGSDRWGLAWTQTGLFQLPLAAAAPAGLAVNINRVSDDNYWRDFTRSSSTLTQRLLPADVLASWAQGNLSTAVHVLQWQILQDPTSPIIPPYDRLPQLTARWAESNARGLDWSVDGDFTQFEANRSLTLQPNAQRAFAWGQLSRPWLVPQGFLIPKVQLHAAAYQFDAALADGSRSATSVVPTLSIDAGLVLERDASWWGNALVQTLEPRAFYVLTPRRDQSVLPNYDTALSDFNFASIYSENAFVGHDKIADNNLLTLGLTSRLLDPETGAQWARLGVAQRLRFEDQTVTLNSASAAAQSGISDVLLGAALNLGRRWTVDSTVQYNPRTEQSVRSVAGVRFNPGNYRVLNAAYRFQRDLSEQLDVSWQWPLNDLWGDRGLDLGAGRGQGEGRYYSVGRMNYSLNEGRLVDAILGVEYDAGCWLGRVVLARTQTSASTATERLMFQLEFVGFTRVGIDPLGTLSQNISRYQKLRDPGAAGGSSSTLY